MSHLEYPESREDIVGEFGGCRLVYTTLSRQSNRHFSYIHMQFVSYGYDLRMRGNVRGCMAAKRGPLTNRVGK
jgi:hypothetical protein